MPSLYEPCGLNQLYSLSYGTVPIVRATGGLADTVVDALPSTLENRTATGFAFREARPEPFWQAILRALTLWPDRDAWRRLVENGMKGEWSWTRSPDPTSDSTRKSANERRRHDAPRAANAGSITEFSARYLSLRTNESQRCHEPRPPGRPASVADRIDRLDGPDRRVPRLDSRQVPPDHRHPDRSGRDRRRGPSGARSARRQASEAAWKSRRGEPGGAHRRPLDCATAWPRSPIPGSRPP